MGIKGLNKLINQYAASAISQKHISEFSGSRVAIDSEILIHKYRSVDSKNSHIFGFLNNVFWHLENGIIPIYVFDGCPSVAKQTNVLTKRLNYREQINRRVEELENTFVEQLDNIDKYPSEGKDSVELNPEINDTLDQLFKIQRKMTFMTVGKNHRNECKYLLKLLGIPFIVANEDAEAFCVTLQKQGFADYVYTEDTDIIPYFIASMESGSGSGSDIKILRKGHFNSMVTVIDINEILRKMNLTPKSFIDMCILSGCDFCSTISKIGPMKAYAYMQKYHSIENLQSVGISIPEDFKYQDARDIFFKKHDTPIEKTLNLGEMNIIDLKTYLSEERGLIPEPIINKYQKIYNIFQARFSSVKI